MRTQKEIDADPGKGMQAEALNNFFNPISGGEHAYFDRNWWKLDVENDDTDAGYWLWLQSQLEQEEVEESEEPTSAYAVELTKKIVVIIEADSPQEALDIAINDDSGYDGAWDRAEIHGILPNDL